LNTATFDKIDDLEPLVGDEIYVSDWLAVTQERINLFAEATGDFQWIHVDVERARRESSFGGTIAHGLLTLSLIASFAQQSVFITRKSSGVNVGFNKVRFISPVLAGSRIRARSTLSSFDRVEGGAQLTWLTTVEIEGKDRPACVAEVIGRLYY
jgi:acyl dehydratase